MPNLANSSLVVYPEGDLVLWRNCPQWLDDGSTRVHRLPSDLGQGGNHNVVADLSQFASGSSNLKIILYLNETTLLYLKNKREEIRAARK
jgi:hypothetical protein